MSFIDNPEMKEIVDDFCDESLELFDELEDLLDDYEDDVMKTELLAEFGQKIDRIMGAAKSMGADDIGNYCELGKIIGYKASQTSKRPLLEMVCAILFDAIDILKRMTKQIKERNPNYTEGISTKAFGTRLHWLSDKFKEIDRASCDFDSEKSKELEQGNIDNLLEDLGL